MVISLIPAVITGFCPLERVTEKYIARTKVKSCQGTVAGCPEIK
jgi:hypothetical protein